MSSTALESLSTILNETLLLVSETLKQDKVKDQEREEKLIESNSKIERLSTDLELAVKELAVKRLTETQVSESIATMTEEFQKSLKDIVSTAQQLPTIDETVELETASLLASSESSTKPEAPINTVTDTGAITTF